MLVKIFGIIDLILGIILIFGIIEYLPNSALAIFGFILLVKSSLGMLKDFASWVDFIGGLVFLVSIIISVHSIVPLIIGLCILQKGVFSLI
jgi:hypothetical protein